MKADVTQRKDTWSALRTHYFEPHLDRCRRCRRTAIDIVENRLVCEPVEEQEAAHA